jgi:hypothetical protein
VRASSPSASGSASSERDEAICVAGIVAAGLQHPWAVARAAGSEARTGGVEHKFFVIRVRFAALPPTHGGAGKHSRRTPPGNVAGRSPIEGALPMSTTSRGIQLASAAAALAFSAMTIAAPSPSGSSGKAIAAGDKVHCYGINSCKGQADCKTANNACKGQGSCKGQGFKGVAAAECLKDGGTIADI